MALRISALARRTGASAPTIRYYEEIGLLPRPGRRESGHRTYGEADVRRLTFIRRCREFGFPIPQVRSLLNLTEDASRPCVEAADLAQEQLGAVRLKLAELKALEASLEAFLQVCASTCAGGPGPDCVPLQDLARPEQR